MYIMIPIILYLCPFFFFNDTATTEIYTLSLHDALPISILPESACKVCPATATYLRHSLPKSERSEEHTSELQSLRHLVCRLLLEKKKIAKNLTVSITATPLTRLSRCPDARPLARTAI